MKQGVPLYKITDLNNELIKGSINENEMLIIEKDEKSLWFIEKV